VEVGEVSHVGSSQQDPERTPRIVNVQIFAELPASLSDLGRNVTVRAPRDLIESADREMELGGELISHVKTEGTLVGRVIERLEDCDWASLLSDRVKSSLWEVYYGSAASGVRYSVLVEFRVHPGRRFHTEESRRDVFSEFFGLFARAALEHLRSHPDAPRETLRNYAINSASHRVRVKYGISTEEMLDIIAEGFAKWTPLDFK
jgi:hypothetical protein